MHKKKEKTPEEIKYNRAKGSFKRRITSMLDNKGVRVVQFQLDHIIESEKAALFYKDITRDDAIIIIQDKVNDYNESVRNGRTRQQF